MPSTIPWSRVAAEGAAIVLSILLAFAIQASWEKRTERRSELEYLEALRDELDANAGAIDSNSNVAAGTREHLENALRLMEAGLYVDSAEVFVSSIVRAGTSAGPPRISTAVHDDLTSSGRAVLIRDADLRRSVLAYYTAMDLMLQRMERRSDELDVDLYAVVARHLPPGTLRRPRNSFSVSLDESTSGRLGLRSVADDIGTDSTVRRELRAAFLLQEDERAFRDVMKEATLATRDRIALVLDRR